jgi:hypothetical protein
MIITYVKVFLSTYFYLYLSRENCSMPHKRWIHNVAGRQGEGREIMSATVKQRKTRVGECYLG